MITNNVILRTFFVQIASTVGTIFTIDKDGRQYLITAKHIAEKLDSSSEIKIYQEKQWKTLPVKLVGHCDGEIDISVLAASIQVSPTSPLEATSAGLIYGQDVYFLGFPYGMRGEIGKLNRNFPMPFVKKAIVSCIGFGRDVAQTIYLDGYNNPGFSGGPVVFKKPGYPDFIVASVISGFKSKEEKVYDGDQELALYYKYNTGIIVSYGIKHAVDVIETNPIGYLLSS